MYRLAVALCALLIILADPSQAAAIGVSVAGGAYSSEAHRLRRLPEEKDAPPRVVIGGERKVQATVLSGTLRVTSVDGTVVALMTPGTALGFAPQEVAGVQAPFEMSGCLERRQGRFVLRDLVSGVLEEVRGNRLELEVGNTVEVTAMVVPGVTPIDGAREVIEISRLRRISGGCAAAAPAVETPQQGMSHRWNGHGFFAVGGSLADIGAGFKGAGGGVEAFIWRGVAAGGEVSVFRDTYGGANRNLDHAGANVSYHFTARERTRRMDPFVLFGVGRFFSGESRAVVHGGGGFTYWFKQRVGARFEFRVGEWQYAEYTVGAFRLGIAFR